MAMESLAEETARMWRQEHPPFLAKLTCGHIERFVLSPRRGWEEWCTRCKDFCVVIDGV